MGGAKDTIATIIPGLQYRDAAAAIDWLCDAFGFERHAVYSEDDGTIAHAQLKFGNGMIMLGTARGTNGEIAVVQPAEIEGAVTQSPYVIVQDVDAHHARAKEAGASIVTAPEDQPYGRLYVCRDLEGHLWNFGDYDPWSDSDVAGAA